jgi:hypothetical protein
VFDDAAACRAVIIDDGTFTTCSALPAFLVLGATLLISFSASAAAEPRRLLAMAPQSLRMNEHLD